MIRITIVRDAMNVRRNATKVRRAKCRSELAGIDLCDTKLLYRTTGFRTTEKEATPFPDAPLL
jgi:hypothetical protein